MSIIRILISGIFTLFCMALNASETPSELINYVRLNEISWPEQLDAPDEVEWEVKKYVDVHLEKSHWWQYKILSASHFVNSDKRYFLVQFSIKSSMMKEYIEYYRESLMQGLGPIQREQIALLEFVNNTVVKVELDTTGIGTALSFSNAECRSGVGIFELDVDADEDKETFFIKSYDSRTDFREMFYKHYWIAMQDEEINFSEWLLNADSVVFSDNSTDAPGRTGLSEAEGVFDKSIVYDADRVLTQPELAVERINSLFFFVETVKKQNIEKKHILVWSKIYRPAKNGNVWDFDVSENIFTLYSLDKENDMYSSVSLNEVIAKEWINTFGIKFEDGLTLDRLCKS